MIAIGPALGLLATRHPLRRSWLVLAVIAAEATVWTAVLAQPGPAPLWLLVLLIVVLAAAGPGSMVGIDISRTSNPSGSLGVAQSMTNLGGFLASLVVLAGMGAIMTAMGGFTPEAFRMAWLLQYPVWADRGGRVAGQPASGPGGRRTARGGAPPGAGRAGRGAPVTGGALTGEPVPPRDLVAARARAVELAESAGRLQVRRRADVVVQGTKAHANDLVSDVDHASEALIVDGLRADWPDDGVLAEEGRNAPTVHGWRWVIDPLDGTRNYLSRAGPWSVCLALQFAEVTQVAVVHDPAARGDVQRGPRRRCVPGHRADPGVRHRAARRGHGRAELQPVAGGPAADGRADRRAVAGRSATSAGCRPRSTCATWPPAGWRARSAWTPGCGTSRPAC